MFRTITIYKGERITVKQNRMVVENDDGSNSIPIEDIYSVIIDNQQTMLSVPVISALTANGTHIIICNKKHLPDSVILPYSLHYHPLTVMRKQLSMTDDLCDELWDKIIKQKIINQAFVLKECCGNCGAVTRLLELSNEVFEGDAGNREGIAARLFFHAMYGLEFVRMHDDSINAALNYGYTIIRSAVAKSLVGYGYNSVIGIHHINESNPFNLADDMMEPLRPIVDMWVSQNHEDLVDDLTKQQKNELASLVNHYIEWDGKTMKIRNAIDKYISSLTTSINKQSSKYLKIPSIIKEDIYNDLDE